MKKICILILCLLISGSCFAIGFSAAAADITAEMNYLTNTIDAEYTNSRDYDAYVAVYITKSAEGGLPGLGDIIKMDKAFCKSGAAVSFKFKCDENILTGNYSVTAVLSGSKAVKSCVPGGVLIVSNAEREDWLKDINNAPETAVLPDLAVADMIYSKIGAHMGYKQPEGWKNEYVFAIRRDDFNNAFPDFADITRAWAAADKIYAMRCAETPEALAAITDGDDGAAWLDTSNEDYQNYKLEFAAVFKKLIDAADAKSITSVQLQFKQASALTAVNERNTDGKAKALTEYGEELKIKSLHDRIAAAGAVNVARLLDGFKSSDIDSVYPKILSALQEVESSNPIKPGGGGGGGSSGSSSRYNGVSVPGGHTSPGKNDLRRFSDVSAEHWAEKYIEELAADGVISGYADGTFCAEKTVSREELVKMIVKAFSISGSSNLHFSDVSGSFWAKDDIGAAVACGIINGISDNEFGVGISVTRQDAAVMVCRALTYRGCSLNGEGTAFGDRADIAPYAGEAIAALTGAQLINGFEDGTFGPGETLTRAQTAKILCLARRLVK